MKRFIKFIVKCVLLFFLCAGAFFGYSGYKQYKDLTSNKNVAQIVETIEASPDFIPYEQLPKTLVDATVAIEDRRFFYHHGVDYIGIVRAVASQFVPGMLESGGSTISQQTVKNMYGLFDFSLQRKVAEIFLTNDLENTCSKEEIFALYVNIINYGNGYTGIYEASSGYFGLYPQQMNEGQCTILAGIPQSPANYDLVTHFDKAKNRQRLVLEAMVENGYLSQTEAEQVWLMPI